MWPRRLLQLLLHLQVLNLCVLPRRLEVDISQVELQLRLVGALLSDRRAASWQLPRLIPLEGAKQQFKLKVGCLLGCVLVGG